MEDKFQEWLETEIEHIKAHIPALGMLGHKMQLEAYKYVLKKYQELKNKQ